MKKLLLLPAIGLCMIACTKKSESTKQKTTPITTEKPIFENKGKQLVYNMVQKVGTLETLKAKKDVIYTYTYTTPDHQTDISTEKYLFEGELSLGDYQQHQRTLAHLQGHMIQVFNGNSFELSIDGAANKDKENLKMVAFNRPTNYYWFSMFQKLLDPGLTYEYLKSEKRVQNTYDVVKIGFETQNNKPTDIYQLYINQKTQLVDFFLFTVADFGLIENPLIMEVDYENIDGMLIPTKRKYRPSDWEATPNNKPYTTVTWTQIQFDNNLTVKDFKL